MENVIELYEFVDLYSIEESMCDLIEGNLKISDRKIKLNIHGEIEANKFYRAITNPNSGWIVSVNKNNSSNISYWIAPNAILVFPKVIQNGK